MPPWAQKSPFNYLVRLDSSHQRISPSNWGNALTALIIAGLAFSLYGSSLAVIYALSSSWKICPLNQDAGPARASKAAPDAILKPAAPTATTTQPPQRLSSHSTVGSQATPETMASTAHPDLSQVFAAIDQLANTISDSQKYRLKAQLIQFQNVQQTSCQIGIFFFANRNATLSVCTAAAILSVASLVFISKNGWEGTNNLVITIGLSSGLVLFSTWTFSQLYGQGVNYENQKTKVALATDTINRIASATANQSNTSLVKNSDTNGTAKTITIDLNNPKDLAALINALDDQLRVLTNLDFTGDYSFAEQSAKRFGDMINGSLKTLAPTPAIGPASR